MNYLRQIQRGIDYVEENLEGNLDLAEVSRVSGVSHWHFQRMFRALTKESLKSYVRTRRLSKARVLLADSQSDVLEIALRSGFESQASFTRAFRRAFGIPPGQYRKNSAQAVAVHKERLRIEGIRHRWDKVSLHPDIAQYPVRHFVGLRTDYFGPGSERDNMAQKLPALWDQILDRIEEIEHAIPHICYGLIGQSETEQEGLVYIAGREVTKVADQLPDQMVHVSVQAGEFACFQHRGHQDGLDQTVSYIYGAWLMQSKMRHTYDYDIEVYDHRYQAGSDSSVVGYAIPVAKLA